MDSRPNISAVLPAYNEEENLSTTVRELVTVLASLAGDREVLIVNDGSSDGTARVAEALRLENSRVRVFHHDRNLGYGAALRTGFAAAKMDWIFLMDADGQFDPSDLTAFTSAARWADLVVGYRIVRADPSHRAWYARAWRLLMRLHLGIAVRDIDCAFKLMRRTVVQSLELESSGAFISAELLAKGARARARLTQLPVRHRPRQHGRSSGGNPRVVLRAFREWITLGGRVRRFGSLRDLSQELPT